MSIKGLTVVFKEDYSEYSAEKIADAIKQLRGVADVLLIETASADQMARSRVRDEIGRKIMDVYNEIVPQPMRAMLPSPK